MSHTNDGQVAGLDREDWIMLLLFTGGRSQKYNEPVVGKTRLMKQMFLLREQAKLSAGFYDFEPYKFGPNSMELLSDLDHLQNRGLIQTAPARGGTSYTLTPDGVRRASEAYARLDVRTREHLVRIKTRFNSMPLPELMAYVYEFYPKYAVKSEYSFQYEE